MAQVFQRDSLTFEYPDDWTLEEETLEGGWTVSIQSPTTAYLVISYQEQIDDATAMAEAVLQGLQESYESIESDDAVESIAGLPAIGYDVHFFHLDFTNTAWIRSLPTGDGGLLLMAQTCDNEIDEIEPLIREIFAGLQLTD